MSVVLWEEPDEDTSDTPTVVYDERGCPLVWLNHTSADLLSDPEWILHHPTGDEPRGSYHYWGPSQAPPEHVAWGQAWASLVNDHILNSYLRAR